VAVLQARQLSREQEYLLALVLDLALQAVEAGAGLCCRLSVEFGPVCEL
jgi:hypothetical protein